MKKGLTFCQTLLKYIFKCLIIYWLKCSMKAFFSTRNCAFFSVKSSLAFSVKVEFVSPPSVFLPILTTFCQISPEIFVIMIFIVSQNSPRLYLLSRCTSLAAKPIHQGVVRLFCPSRLVARGG